MQEDLKLTIRAKDEASETIKKVEKELGNVSSSMKKAGAASESMAVSVAKGTAAYDLIQKSVKLAIDFFADCAKESMDSARIMTQVETNVKNAGFAYDELAPKIKAYSDNAIQLGFDDETAAQSLSKLLLVTKDYGQAQALTNLAMDLARSKNVDLETATKQVTLATQGNVKELKLLGIDLDETATTAENLTKMQDQLKDSAVGFAKTAAGQYASLREEASNLKQKIGDDLMPSVVDMLNIINQNKGTVTALADGFIFLGKAVGFAVKGVVGFANIFATGISGIAEGTAKDIDLAAKGLNKLGLVSDETVAKTTAKAKEWGETTKAAAEATLDLYNDTPKLTASLTGTSDALKLVKDRSSNATATLESLKEKVAEAQKGFKTFGDTAGDELITLADTHKEASTKIVADITNVKKQLKDLASTYSSDLASAMKTFNDASKSNSNDLVSSIVANETAIANLKAKLTGGGLTQSDQVAIQEELDGRLKAEEKNAGLISTYSTEIANLKAYNAMSELDQAVSDFEQKKSLAQQEYDDTVSKITSVYKEKKKALTQELNDLKSKQQEEETLYDEKVAFIKAKQAEALTTNQAYSAANLKVTKDQVITEINYYEQLAKAIKAARSASTSEFAAIKTKVSSIATPSHEHGGTVIGARGTEVPIIAHGGETIIPAGQSRNSGNTIVVTLNYPQVKSKDDIDVVRDQIEKALRDVIRVNKVQF